MMQVACFTCPWATRDKLKAGPTSTINLYWKKNKCKYVKIHTVRDTLVLHFQVLVGPGARVWKHIRAGNNRTLGPITAPGKQQRRVREQTRQEDRARSWVAPPVSKRCRSQDFSISWGAHRGWRQTPTSSSAYYQKRRGMVAQAFPSRRYFFNTSIFIEQNAMA